MTEKITVEVDAKIYFGKKCKNWQTPFLNAFFHSFPKKVWPNLKPYYERFLSEFYENGNKSYLVQQMIEKIAVKVDAKIRLGKKYKNWQQLLFYNTYFYSFQNKLDQIWNHIMKDFFLNFMKMVSKSCVAQKWLSKLKFS